MADKKKLQDVFKTVGLPPLYIREAKTLWRSAS
jgi:hypothetical protein